MQEKILSFLREKQGYVSGEEMSSYLKISRQGLWKHIQELKELGYDIAAVPHLGYQIISSPDRLFPSEIRCKLKTKFIGQKIHYFDSLPSTMDTAMDLGMKGAPEGTLVISEGQTKGRGRLGREWSSPKYKGIYISLLLRPRLPPNSAPILTLLAGVSLCEAIKEKSELDIKIKWPNDLLIHNKKVGGILTELNAQMDVAYSVVIGIGLNVNNSANTLIGSATSLREQKGSNFGRVELLQEILRKIEECYLLFQQQGAGPIIDKWRSYNITLGRRAKVASYGRNIEGQAIDIDNDGGLLLRKDNGLIEKIMAGDVVCCR